MRQILMYMVQTGRARPASSLACSKAPRRQFFRTCLYFIEYLRDLGFNERELEETGGSGSKTGKQGRSENFVSGGLGEN